MCAHLIAQLKLHACCCWLILQNNMLLIEDEDPTLEDLGIVDEDQLLIEVRNKDLTWPEEMGSLAIPMQDKRKQGEQYAQT